MPARAPAKTHSPDWLFIAVMAVASMLVGAWELAITRVASVLFFYDLAYLVLALCLFGIGAGALVSRRIPRWLSVYRLFLVLVVSMTIGYFGLYHTVWAWRFCLFIVPFVVFGCLSAGV